MLVVPSPAGEVFTQEVAYELAEEEHLVFACGRYEGIDERFIDWAREYIAITQDTRPLDFVNWDEAAPEIMASQAVPIKWVNDIQTVTAMRQQKAQAAQQQQMVEAAPALASVAKPLMAGVKR